MKTTKLKHGQTTYFKGYYITKIGKIYEAGAYGNPTFYNTNMAKLKQAINQYLRD